jgi:hypothetical protein
MAGEIYKCFNFFVNIKSYGYEIRQRQRGPFRGSKFGFELTFKETGKNHRGTEFTEERTEGKRHT